jgi:hypothetical protein
MLKIGCPECKIGLLFRKLNRQLSSSVSLYRPKPFWPHTFFVFRSLSISGIAGFTDIGTYNLNSGHHAE